jgi:hypothetical protein
MEVGLDVDMDVAEVIKYYQYDNKRMTWLNC